MNNKPGFRGKDGTLYLDALSFRSHIKLNFVERMRLLFGRRLYVQFEIATQRAFGKYQANSICFVEKIFTTKRPDIDAIANHDELTPQLLSD